MVSGDRGRGPPLATGHTSDFAPAFARSQQPIRRRAMNKVPVLGCALAAALALAVGCYNSTKPDAKHDAALKGYEKALADLDKEVEELKATAEKATGEEKSAKEAFWKAAAEKRDAAKKKLEELKKVAAEKWDAAEKETKEAFENFKKALPSRDAAVRAYESALSDLDKKADALKAKIEKATGEEKAKLEAAWKATADKRAAAQKKLDELKKAAAEKWDAVEKEAKEAFEALKKAIGD